MDKKWLKWFGITALLYIIYLYNLGVPALLDSDETRYADMARSMMLSKDFITPYLDGKIFWDKPPLFFWILCLSYKIFGVNEFAVRFPSVLAALTTVAAVFFAVRKTVSERAALYSALILASSVEFVIFARISILDMVLCACISLSLIAGFMTYFAEEKNKKWFWSAFYLFSALGVLTKGIPAVVIPFGTMFFIGIWKKNLKEFFKPQYFIAGILIFCLIALPWHILMYKIHGAEFINEYIIMHHFKRFAGCAELGRRHSFLYYIPTFIVGFLPWTLTFLFSFKKIIKDRKNDFVTMNLVGFVFTFLFFSIAGTKLITYILPLYPMCAAVCGYVWANKDYEKEIRLSVILTGACFVIFALLVSCAGLYLPADIYSAIKSEQWLVAGAFMLCGVLSLVSLNVIPTVNSFRNRLLRRYFGSSPRNDRALCTYILLIAFLSGILIPRLLNVWYSFGQNDLMGFAKYAKENRLPLGAYNIWERFSLQYYYGGDVEYFKDGEAYGAKYVQTTEFKKSFNNKPIVIENSAKIKNIKYKTIKKGKRYSLVEEIL